MANTQSKVNILEEQNSKLIAEIEELKREKVEFLTKEASFKARIVELEHTLKDYETRFVNLEQKDNEKTIHMAKLDDEIMKIKKSSANTTLTEMENSNDTPEQIDVQTEDVSASDISDITSNSSHFVTASGKDTYEQIIPRNEESIISSHEVSTSSNSDIQQELETSTSPISAEAISLEEKEENEFLDLRYKEQVSKEIMERIREKRLRDQNLSSDRGVASLQGNNNLSCDIKTVSQGNDQQKTIMNTSLPTEDLDDSDEIELTKNQNIELDLIRDLRNSMLIITPDPIETPPEDIVDNEKSSSKHSVTASGKITTQSLINLFRKAIRSGHEEILSWICYSDNFENKVIEIRHKTGVSDKTARAQIYKEMLEHLSGVTSVALRIKTLRARKIRKLFGENGVELIKLITSKTVSQGNDQNHTEDFKSLPESKVCIPSASESITEKALPEKQTHDRDYFRNKTLLRYSSSLYKTCSNKKFDYYDIIEGSLCPICKQSHEGGKSVKDYSSSHPITASGKMLTDDYYKWYAELDDLPSSLTDKIRLILYRAYTEETGLDPWVKPESSQIEKDADIHLSGIIKISKFPEEKDVIIEAVHKRFPFLSYTNSNAWYRDVFKYTDSKAECPVCKKVHTHRGIWGDWSCLDKNDHYFLNCPFRSDQKKVIIAVQSLPEIQIR
ncbi:10578_t:CDS:2, partial [Entrophospora sp. SA101]